MENKKKIGKGWVVVIVIAVLFILCICFGMTLNTLEDVGILPTSTESPTETEVFTKTIAPTESPTQTPLPTETPDAALEYELYTQVAFYECGDSSNYFSALLLLASEDNSYLFNEDWRNDANKAITEFKNSCGNLGNYDGEIPTVYEEFNATLVKSGLESSIAADLYLDGINNLDGDKIIAANEHLNTALLYLDEADALLETKKLNNGI
jgi:hypothetical protein